jgi:hypothetical protein
VREIDKPAESFACLPAGRQSGGSDAKKVLSSERKVYEDQRIDDGINDGFI